MIDSTYQYEQENMTKVRKKGFSTGNLRKARGLRKKTQEESAAALGIDQSQYARYESGKSEPSLSLFAAMAEYFDVSPDYLLGKTDNPIAHKREEDLTSLEREVVLAFNQRDFKKIAELMLEPKPPGQ